MSTDRGAGAFLRKRLGGGKEVYRYGGSFSLAEASLKNSRLDRKHKDAAQHIDNELGKHIKSNLRERHSLKEQLQKLELDKKTFEHYDGDDGPNPANKSPKTDSPPIPGRSTGEIPYWPYPTRKRSLSFPESKGHLKEHSSDRRTRFTRNSSEDGDYPYHSMVSRHTKMQSATRALENRHTSEEPPAGTEPHFDGLELIACSKRSSSVAGYGSLLAESKSRTEKYRILLESGTH